MAAEKAAGILKTEGDKLSEKQIQALMMTINRHKQIFEVADF